MSSAFSVVESPSNYALTGDGGSGVGELTSYWSYEVSLSREDSSFVSSTFGETEFSRMLLDSFSSKHTGCGVSLIALFSGVGDFNSSSSAFCSETLLFYSGCCSCGIIICCVFWPRSLSVCMVIAF